LKSVSASNAQISYIPKDILAVEHLVVLDGFRRELSRWPKVNKVALQELGDNGRKETSFLITVFRVWGQKMLLIKLPYFPSVILS
jgi:hypothetical protein